MTFESVFATVAHVIEGIGVVIMAVGLVVVLARFCRSVVVRQAQPGGYEQLRVSMGRVILLGLEILIVGDIVGTIIVQASLTSVAVLGLIVVIRTVLSFTLEVELTGRWPWRKTTDRSQADGFAEPK
ncbi:MAG TPA: DUF1622 domain-containing protein [Pseudonocardiaceae bacterium]|jgi:uncharacterized membrane protein